MVRSYGSIDLCLIVQKNIEVYIEQYSGDVKSDHVKSRLFEGHISNGWALAMAIAIVPTIQKPDHSKSGLFLFRFQMVFDKMAVICPDFKWVGFRISDLIQNQDH